MKQSILILVLLSTLFLISFSEKVSRRNRMKESINPKSDGTPDPPAKNNKQNNGDDDPKPEKPKQQTNPKADNDKTNKDGSGKQDNNKNQQNTLKDEEDDKKGKDNKSKVKASDAEGPQSNKTSDAKDTKANAAKVGKTSNSVRILAHFLSKLTESDLGVDKTILNIKKNCKTADRMKFFKHMDSRIRESKLNVAKLMGEAQNGDKTVKSQNNKKVTAIIQRLFKEYYVNLINCEFVFAKKDLKLLKSLISTLNDSFWGRCKSKCDPFVLKNLIEDFNDLQFREMKSLIKAKKTGQDSIIEHNAGILASLAKKYEESKESSSKEPQPQKNSAQAQNPTQGVKENPSPKKNNNSSKQVDNN